MTAREIPPVLNPKVVHLLDAARTQLRRHLEARRPGSGVHPPEAHREVHVALGLGGPACARAEQHGEVDLGRRIQGRLVENAVGGHLLNYLAPPRFTVGYWRERNDEIDYVVAAGRKRIGIEVKSGRAGRLKGLEGFRRRFPKARTLVVGSGGIPLDEFFKAEPASLLELA